MRHHHHHHSGHHHHHHHSGHHHHHHHSGHHHHHHHSGRQQRNAFVAPMDSRGNVMVVRDRRSGKWMLPGGRVESGETSAQGAVREMWEETGNKIGGPLRRVERLRPGSRSDRLRRFHRRSHKNETADHGFVNPYKRRLVVKDHRGRKKDVNPVSFRRGTVSHLWSLKRRRSGSR